MPKGTSLNCSVCPKLREFAKSIKRPFSVYYNPYTQSVDLLKDTRSIENVVQDLRSDLTTVGERFGVAEHQVVPVIKLKHLLPLRAVQLGEIILGDSGRGPLRPRVPVLEVREGELFRSADAAQQEVGVLLQALDLPNEVVGDQTRAAELADPLPVDVHPNGSLRVQQVLNELPESDAGASIQSRLCGVGPVPGNDGPSEHGMIVEVRIFKLVPEGRDEPLEGLPDEQNLGVGSQSLGDTGPIVAVQPPQLVAVMSCIVRNILSGLGSASQNHQDPFPVGAGGFRHLTVQQSEPVLHVKPRHLLQPDLPPPADRMVLGADVVQLAAPRLLRPQLRRTSRGGALQQQLPVALSDGLLLAHQQVRTKMEDRREAGEKSSTDLFSLPGRNLKQNRTRVKTRG
ncbi:hypothetical protein CCH79_00016943 [Gambusia affinis]|uniref:Biopterin-dependent aromatic amino acid hydroxylase family profile domain-containing protein n=1 Tax=Gambusia affinis TaxID=33528 RepID=A0A315VJ83_GAMAF|nr:hypothetical protein CCH79_00016943 [Gambusia affinis]